MGKKIRKGEFRAYLKHPANIYFKNDKKNVYKVVVTGTSDNGDVYPLKHPISPNVNRSFIKKRPVICRRKDLGSKAYIDMKFDKEDKALIKYVQRKENYFFSKSAKSLKRKK